MLVSKTIISQFLSPFTSLNGYWQTVTEGVRGGGGGGVTRWSSIQSRGSLIFRWSEVGRFQEWKDSVGSSDPGGVATIIFASCLKGQSWLCREHLRDNRLLIAET